MEADRAADYVTDMAAPSAGSNGEEKGQVRQTAGHTQPSAAGETVAPFTADEAKLSSGQKLDPATRSFFEPRFGHDFSRVRVHADGDSARLSESLNAHAFTYGSNIYFNRAQYNPASPEGKHLLAHELAHVVQQSGGAGLVQRQPKRQPKTTKPVRSGDRRDISEFLTSMSRRVNVLLGLELQDDFGSLEKEVLKHATSKERVITEELFDEPKIELPPLTIAFIRGLGEVTATGVPFDELIDLSARITALNAATAVEPSFKETERRILEELARPRGRRIDSEL
ncbi:MAG TPA: DUF4157 domain-containing protein [Blastocatellia bacterium]|nr:DUF4157 domain-containing protein [Blastocatellia bacterium]